jgi:hypothetical protein
MKPKSTRTLALFMVLMVQVLFAQQQTISGTVSDENSLPLPGATVIIDGTSSGTSTDFDGNYQINANVGDVLNFSYVGYATQNITVGNANTINVTLQPDNTLEEVVVTAQNIRVEKKALGYAVSSVPVDEISNKPSTGNNIPWRLFFVHPNQKDIETFTGVFENPSNGNFVFPVVSFTKTTDNSGEIS